MKSKLLSLLVCGGVLVVAGGNAAGGPVKRADVAANPVWVVHLDCDSLRNTAVGKFLLAELEKPEAQAKLAAFQALVNVDPRTQLHGLTLYSTGSTPQEGVLLVYADFDADRLTTLAKAAHDSQETPYKQTTIYSWVDEKKKAKDGEKPRTYAAIAGSRVIFAQREEQVAKALDVLSGAAPALAAGKELPQVGATASASFFQAAARKLDFASKDPNAAILKLSKLANFQLGETSQQVNASLSLEANDEEVAKNMHSIAQGLVSLMKLQKEKPVAMKIAEAIDLKQDGPTVNARLKLPADDVIELIKAHAARKEQRKAAKEKQE